MGVGSRRVEWLKKCGVIGIRMVDWCAVGQCGVCIMGVIGMLGDKMEKQRVGCGWVGI